MAKNKATEDDGANFVSQLARKHDTKRTARPINPKQIQKISPSVTRKNFRRFILDDEIYDFAHGNLVALRNHVFELRFRKSGSGGYTDLDWTYNLDAWNFRSTEQAGLYLVPYANDGTLIPFDFGQMGEIVFGCRESTRIVTTRRMNMTRRDFDRIAMIGWSNSYGRCYEC